MHLTLFAHYRTDFINSRRIFTSLEPLLIYTPHRTLVLVSLAYHIDSMEFSVIGIISCLINQHGGLKPNSETILMMGG